MARFHGLEISGDVKEIPADFYQPPGASIEFEHDDIEVEDIEKFHDWFADLLDENEIPISGVMRHFHKWGRLPEDAQHFIADYYRDEIRAALWKECVG